jgi:hypothetical protein
MRRTVAAAGFPAPGNTIAASSTLTDRPSFNRAIGSPFRKLNPTTRIFSASPAVSTASV